MDEATKRPQAEDGKKLDEQWEANKAAADGRREAEAKERGGYLYTLPLGQPPIAIAQHYGGKRPGVLLELLEINPPQEAGPCGVCTTCERRNGSTCPQPRARWSRWFVGLGILIPVAWGDPRKKGDPPVVAPKALGRRNHQSAIRAQAIPAAGAEAAKRAKP